MTTLKSAKNIIVREMKNSGTMKRIDQRIEKHNLIAKALGFENAQIAFKSMGKSFLTIANA